MSGVVVPQSLIAIGLMVIITYLSRAGGLLIMSWIPISPRVKRFVDAMSSSVLIAVITPMIIHGDDGARLAALVAGGVAVLLRNPLLAIGLGMVTAALWRHWSPGG